MRRFRLVTTTLLASVLSLSIALFAFVGTASAHAKVISATPGIGSTIAAPPSAVTVQTAENMNPDPKLSNLFVYGPSGDLISNGNAKVSLNNPKEMSVQIKPEKAGTYVVRWITVSADDGDPDQGAFVFTVKAAATSTTTAAQPSSGTKTVAPANASSSFPIIPVALTAVIALIIGLGGGFAFGRRSAPAPAPSSSPATQTEEVPTKRS